MTPLLATVRKMVGGIRYKLVWKVAITSNVLLKDMPPNAKQLASDYYSTLSSLLFDPEPNLYLLRSFQCLH